MTIAIIIGAVIVLTIVAIIIFKKKPTPPVVSPTPIPSTPAPSSTPFPSGTTEIEVLSAGPSSRNIMSIRVDGKLVDGDFPILPGNIKTYTTDQTGASLDVQVRFGGLPAGTESIALYCGSYSDCVTGPAAIHDFQGVPVNGTKINIDYDEVGC